MPYIRITKRIMFLLVALSLALFIVSLLTLLMVFAKEIKARPLFKRIGRAIIMPVNFYFNCSIVLSLIIALLPLAILDWLNRRYIYDVEKYIPVFLREVADGIRSGLSLTRAIEEASLRGFGALGAEFRKIMARVFLGESFENALRMAREQLPSRKFAEMTSILEIAYESGGQVVEVLETAAKVFSDVLAFENDRRSSVKPYATVIYASVVLFLITSFFIIEVFYRPFAEQAGQSLFAQAIDIDVYQAFFFYLAVVESIFSGLIVGKMLSGSVKAGLIHIVTLLSIVLLFYVLVFPILRQVLVVPVVGQTLKYGFSTFTSFSFS